YLEQMQGKVSWASYFRSRNGRIDLYDAFARATTERLLADSAERRGDSDLYASRSTLNAKEWRDGIIRGLAAEGRVAEHAKYTRYIDSRAAERSPEFQSLKTSWTAKLEKFIERLQALGKNGQITEANIAKLLAQPANQTPYAVASVVPGSMGFDPMEGLKGPEITIETSEKRSESRGDGSYRESADFAAHLVRRSFAQYCKRYENLGARAQQRFEDADWTGSQQDIVEDDKTYHASINEAAKLVGEEFPYKVTDPAFWDEVRYRFYIGFKQKEVGKDLAKVFFESVKRSAFKQQEEKQEEEQKEEQKEDRKVFVEYLDESLDKDWFPRRESHAPMRIHLENGQRLGDVIKRAMRNYKFRAHMDDLYGNSILAGAFLNIEFKKRFPQGVVRGADFLDVPLFRNKEAYIFGRVFGHAAGQELSFPFIICLVHSPRGIAIDAVLTEQNDISEVLTTTRSNLFGDLKHYHQILAFLKAYFPVRAKPSLFKIIGFNHVAKVQLLYELRERLRMEKKKFVRAEGIEGKVMVVFNLPEYPYVMKVVRDETPKEGVRDADYVIGKYRKVREMDRAGRMMDYIGLHGVSFPQEAFDKDLLNELLRESSKEVRLEQGRVYFQHIFVQGKLIPLDIFMRSPVYTEAEKRQAILDYGKCIHEIAKAGLFAGDVLIKNYGVSLLTGFPRVFSYDYDDLDSLLNWNFMLTPPPRNEDEEMMADEDRVMFRYTDVVVDQLERYMAPAQYRVLFREHYGRFFTPEFWKDIQDKVRNGVFFESRSYPQKRRLSEIKKNLFPKGDASFEEGVGVSIDQGSVALVTLGKGQSKEASLPSMIKPHDLRFKFYSELTEDERRSAKLLSYFQRAKSEVGFWRDWSPDLWKGTGTDAILVSHKGEFIGAIAFIRRPDGSVLGNGGYVDPRLRGAGIGVVLRENLLRRLKDERWAFYIIGGEESSVPITGNTPPFRRSLEGRPGVSVVK
ncbi:MAG: bifunctional isocitrate dehydrogenase kinase/phosphatase, partial [Geobacteraceae bacterium]|nr:bifunctional isocitrate dehydrogenase kinase/phosphatase [Geobacteraceae bacterium]